MRGTVSIAIPVEMTARQLTALASLVDHVQRGNWAYLAHSFNRLDGSAAQWPPATAEALGRLHRELRRAAHERAELAEELLPEPAPTGR